MFVENLSSLKLFIFKKYIMEDGMNIKTIDPIIWIAGWIFYLGTYYFNIYL